MPSTTCQVATTVSSISFSVRRLSGTTMCSAVQSACIWRRNGRITRLSLSPIQRLMRSAMMFWCCWMKRAADCALAVRDGQPARGDGARARRPAREDLEQVVAVLEQVLIERRR